MPLVEALVHLNLDFIKHTFLNFHLSTSTNSLHLQTSGVLHVDDLTANDLELSELFTTLPSLVAINDTPNADTGNTMSM